MKRRDALATLSKSDYLYKRFDYYLAQRGWPRCDASMDQMTITRISNPENRKRKRPASFDDDHSGTTTPKQRMIMSAARVSTPSGKGKGGSSPPGWVLSGGGGSCVD
ncbi:hypothetical protein OF83DRAFT_1088391 [Amylostereum chailletii]|nr:hypothetical protein OF83DRAFT_1088391 [Amylostereum chailletii]